MNVDGTELAQHWDSVYSSKNADETSWFQRSYDTSIRLLAQADPSHASVIDIGGGVGTLADELLAAGWSDVTVLDISAEALASLKSRLGDQISTITADIRSWEPDRQFRVWHDRAVLHFLTEDADRSHYAELAAVAVEPDGAIVVGCFAPDGPESCSGLPVHRADADELATLFAPNFELRVDERELHITPWGAGQRFEWVVLRRLK